MDSIIFQSKTIRIEVQESQIPWLKIFTQYPYKEMSEVPKDIRLEIYEILHTIELEMISYYQPEKINIASFGNYLPHVHWHIMARFKNDTHFPEPMWADSKRNCKLELPSFGKFVDQLVKELKK